MNKSILVIDTPKCCGECPMSGTDVCRKWNRKDAKTFPKDCPLKKIPDKQVIHCTDTSHHRWVKTGYNICINEILKERWKNEQ